MEIMVLHFGDNNLRDGASYASVWSVPAVI